MSKAVWITVVIAGVLVLATVLVAHKQIKKSQLSSGTDGAADTDDETLAAVDGAVSVNDSGLNEG